MDKAHISETETEGRKEKEYVCLCRGPEQWGAAEENGGEKAI